MTFHAAKLLKWGAIALAVIFASSWIAGQFPDSCYRPKPPKVVPPTVDAGAPVAGPIADSPTVAECLPVAVPELTREDVLAYARKYGLTLPTAPVGERRERPPESAEVDEGSAPPPVTTERREPSILAEEHFTHAASGVAADCSAWFLGEGERVDLRCLWLPWQPPVPAAEPGYFGNVAKFEKGFLVGYVGMKAGEETVASPGLGFSLRYRGWKIGDATTDLGVMGLVTIEGDGAVLGGVGVSW